LSKNEAVFTVAGSLLLVDYESDPPSVAELIAPDPVGGDPGLHTPWGVARDSSMPRRLYVAENSYPGMTTTGRLLQVDLNGKAVELLQPLGQELHRPEDLVVGPGREFLTVLSEAPSSGGKNLLQVSIDDGTVFTRTPQMSVVPVSVDLGDDQLLVLSCPDRNRLLVSGGLEQTSRVTTFDSRNNAVTVDRIFDPPLTPTRRWRILDHASPASTTAGGRRDNFVWASHLDRVGPVAIRVLAMQSNVGTGSEVPIVRTIGPDWETMPQTLTGTGSSEMGIAGPTDLEAADLDGDGLLELICSNEEANALLVFSQSEPGEFSDSPQVLCDSRLMKPVAVSVGDLDQDGDQDLVAGSFLLDNVTIFHQDSAGQFAFALELSDPVMNPQTVELGDLDGNGTLDLVVANNQGPQGESNILFYYQRVDGTFSSPDEIVFDASLDLPRSLAIGDLNADGLPDVVVGNEGPRTLSIFYQNNAGSFSDPPEVLQACGHSVLIADIDLDGDLDLLSGFCPSLGVYYQDSPGLFSGPSVLKGGGRIATVADLDDNGFADVVAVGGNEVRLHFQFAGQRFSEPVLLKDPPMGQPQHAVAADLDGDSDLDLVSVNDFQLNVQDDLKVFLNQSDRTYAPESLELTASSETAVAADLDSDGDLDYAGLGPSPGELWRHLQDDPGVFVPQSALPAPDPAYGIEAADLDGDGDVDLAMTSDADVFLVTQSSPGVFDPPAPLPLRQPLGADLICAGDVDGDGYVDLVVTGFQKDSVEILFQDSQGWSVPPRRASLPGLVFPSTLLLEDFDGDARMDIAIATQNPDNLVQVLFQNSDESFSLVDLSDPGLRIFSVCPVDLDGDGDLDLACPSRGSSSLVVFYQDGLRSFSTPDLAFSLPSLVPWSIASGDVDGDGDEDVVLGGPGRFGVLLRTSPRAFESQVFSFGQGQGGAHQVQLQDVDGDGRQDLMLVNQQVERMYLYFAGHR
jgi:hypothetical protein